MRILFVSHTGACKGGAATSLLKLIEYLKNGNEIKVIIPSNQGLNQQLERLGVDYYVVRSRLRHSPLYLYFLIKLIRSEDIQIVYSNSYSIRHISILAYFASFVTGIPFVWHIREIITARPTIAAHVLAHANRVIAVSNGSGDSIKHWVPKAKISIVPNGIDATDVKLVSKSTAKSYIHTVLGTNEETNKLLINVGAIYKNKAQLLTLDVLSILISKDPSIHLCFVGDTSVNKDYFASVQDKIELLKLTQNVHFVGFRQDVDILLQGSDVFVHTAVKESFGRVVLESMLCGTPVVVYDVPGINETIVHKRTGYLVPFREPALMADRILTLINDQNTRRVLVENAKQHVAQHFSARETAERVRTILCEAVEN